MLIYWIIFVVLGILSFYLKNREHAFIISFIILLFLGSTRGSTVGNDMRGGYSMEFSTIHSEPRTWGRIMPQFEIGFSWLMGNFKDHVANNSMFFFHLLFFITFLMRFYTIRQYSIDGSLTLLFMFGLSYYFNLYNTMRQEFAFSIICLFFPLVLDKKKYFQFVILTIMTAYLFHKSQILLLLLIPVSIFYKKDFLSMRNLIIAIIISYVLGRFGISKIMPFLNSYAFLFEGDNSNYAGYLSYEDNIGSFSTITTLLHSLFCIYIIYLHRERKSVFLLLYVIGVILLNLLTPISWIYQRIAYTLMYFSIFVYTSLWHNITKRNERRIFQVVVIIFMVIIFSRRLVTDNGEDVVPYINYFLE